MVNNPFLDPDLRFLEALFQGLPDGIFGEIRYDGDDVNIKHKPDRNQNHAENFSGNDRIDLRPY